MNHSSSPYHTQLTAPPGFHPQLPSSGESPKFNQINLSFRTARSDRKMRLSTRELCNLNDLVPHQFGRLMLASFIGACLAADVAIGVLLYWQQSLFNPYMCAALLVNLGTLAIAICSLNRRNIFYKPLFMSVVTAACMISYLLTFFCFGDVLVFLISVFNVGCMLVLWTAYATTIKSPPAVWLHPYKRKMNGPSADLAMTEIAA